MIVLIPIGKADPLGNPAVCVTTTPEQLSVALGDVQLTIELHNPGVTFVMMFAGHDVKTGFSKSLTVTLKAQTEMFPYASVAVYEMLVVPIGNNEPLGNPNVCKTVTPAQLSVADGETQFTIAPQTPGLLLVVMFIGQDVNVGA